MAKSGGGGGRSNGGGSLSKSAWTRLTQSRRDVVTVTDGQGRTIQLKPRAGSRVFEATLDGRRRVITPEQLADSGYRPARGNDG